MAASSTINSDCPSNDHPANQIVSVEASRAFAAGIVPEPHLKSDELSTALLAKVDWLMNESMDVVRLVAEQDLARLRSARDSRTVMYAEGRLEDHVTYTNAHAFVHLAGHNSAASYFVRDYRATTDLMLSTNPEERDAYLSRLKFLVRNFFSRDVIKNADAFIAERPDLNPESVAAKSK